MWGNAGRCGEIWGDRSLLEACCCGEMRGDMGRYGEIFRIWGARAATTEGIRYKAARSSPCRRRPRPRRSCGLRRRRRRRPGRRRTRQSRRTAAGSRASGRARRTDTRPSARPGAHISGLISGWVHSQRYAGRWDRILSVHLGQSRSSRSSRSISVHLG